MTEPSTKKKRKYPSKEQRKAKKPKSALQNEDEFVIRWQAPALQADLVLEKLRTLNPNLSAIELTEQSIPERAFIDTSAWESQKREASELTSFLETLIPDFNFSTPINTASSPHTLFISPAALRVADLTRVLKKYRTFGKGEVAKLFARHFKLSEHIDYIKKTHISIAVGTPGRIKALVEVEDGRLKLDKLRYLIIDANYVDGKKRTIFDIPETVRDLFGIITHEDIRKRIADDKLRVVFY